MTGEMGQPVDMPQPVYSNEPPRPVPPPIRPPSSGRKFPLGTAIIALVVVIGSAAALYAFSGAKVSITPAMNQVSITSDFIATASAGDLPFEVISVDKVASNSVQAESTETVNQPAQGTITITNQQAAAQQLIKNTRFQTPDGLIFRIRDSITVPAAKNGTPGSLSVTVYADEAGDKYNVGPTTFTVPGLTGSAAFTQVTGRSADPMQGGFSGPRPSVSQATKDRESQTLQGTLVGDLETAVKEKVPAGYVLVPGSTFATYEPQPDIAGATGTVEVRVKGSITAVVFPAEALAKSVAYKTVGSYSGQPVVLARVDQLKLTPTVNTSPAGQPEFAFSLSGNTTVVWKVEGTKIAAAVAGKTRNSAEVALTGFPEVDRARLVLRPFWKGSFPANPEKITVEVEEAGNAQ
ncbi:MAG: hypothetical protein JWN64_188 [Parcubacteria group bacterium]|nr:hypothetical protein [Parcubacteria group bacterium]